ncbi:NTP pyrophosphatase, house-cleaning of non-canonical NTPs [Desulfonispora thiosulfatigenes DSM 11270]|uniref:NTP pyrophosphatase, house-cleaning of non-canonical NTPs n=1 Tax=Desulfonispora thiosulfatigenes DSM 11270 TaxID=656914 RepID=A0A1W1UHK6_DESTI|nr:nucleotide pyrophosphohydrolase [Desulfonispora thiosulfatigenes]SMB80503.1 NTP pyrophosphatase, house-cleaning of non-canonical NTPs [Desulfonispora thiosulfatigenes DSM 11270]
MDKIISEIRKIREDREWGIFHTPENLAKSISIEAGELLEHFQWDNEFKLEEASDELADIMIYCLYMADSLNVSIEDIMNAKIQKNKAKYPVERTKGNSKKYTEFE